MPQAGMTALRVQAVLFDLDGTLIDSAPDLAGAGNEMRVARGLPALPLQHFRPMVGAGARGMIAKALEVGAQDERYAALRDEFLQRYEARMTRETRIFAGMGALLNQLRALGLPWGIVTNKATRFTEPLVHALGLQAQAAAVVCGDTTPHSKPHPAPLLEAAARMGLAAAQCAYVGDDLRDVQAGRAAGMGTVVAAWGYLGAGESVQDWGADHIIAAPQDLLNWLAMA